MLGCIGSRLLECKISSPAEKKSGETNMYTCDRGLPIVAHNRIGCLKQDEVDRIDVVDAKRLQRQAVG